MTFLIAAVFKITKHFVRKIKNKFAKKPDWGKSKLFWDSLAKLTSTTNSRFKHSLQRRHQRPASDRFTRSRPQLQHRPQVVLSHSGVRHRWQGRHHAVEGDRLAGKRQRSGGAVRGDVWGDLPVEVPLTDRHCWRVHRRTSDFRWDSTALVRQWRLNFCWFCFLLNTVARGFLSRSFCCSNLCYSHLQGFQGAAVG